MATAEDRGWGDCGVPDGERERAYARANITAVTIGGVTWHVHKLVAPIFRELLERYVVPTIGPLTRVRDDWSYAPRCIRRTGPGTGRPCVISNHAWGLAIDVNATQNVQGGSDRDGQFPPDFGRRIRHLMIRWGGDYRSTVDPMHFEFVGAPSDARRIAASLGKPVPRPDPKPEPKPEPERETMIGLFQITGAPQVWAVTYVNGKPVRWQVPNTPTLNVHLTAGWRLTVLTAGTPEADALMAFPAVP